MGDPPRWARGVAGGLCTCRQAWAAAISRWWPTRVCPESGEMKELCALARHALETNGTGGKFTGKGVCTKHLEAFQAFFSRWGQEGIGEKTVGWKCISNYF